MSWKIHENGVVLHWVRKWVWSSLHDWCFVTLDDLWPFLCFRLNQQTNLTSTLKLSQTGKCVLFTFLHPLQHLCKMASCSDMEYLLLLFPYFYRYTNRLSLTFYMRLQHCSRSFLLHPSMIASLFSISLLPNSVLWSTGSLPNCLVKELLIVPHYLHASALLLNQIQETEFWKE